MRACVEKVDVLGWNKSASDRDMYTNLSGTVALLVSELVFANNNLVEELKENTRLERVLVQ